MANEPAGLVIGNCPAGTLLEAVSKSAETGGYYYYGGYLNGVLQGCGWVSSEWSPEKISSNANSKCATSGEGREFSIAESEFVSERNSPKGSGIKDGYHVVNTSMCPEYRNLRPWSGSPEAKELVGDVPAYASEPGHPTEPRLLWRYTTQRPATNKYVMVRDSAIEPGEGNWVFVPESCLSKPLKHEEEPQPPAPTVTTGTPTGIATPNATLVGFVNPNGISTKYLFEYGTSTGYGSYTTTESAGDGTGVVQEDVPIGGLAAGTTYYFRIVASSATGETFGGPVSFTTQATPAVTTNGASDILPVQATLNGSVNPEGLSTEYYFEYGETPTYGDSTRRQPAGSASSGVPVSEVTSGLRPGTTYYYRLVAVSSAGTSSGTQGTFTTPAESAPAVVREAGEGRQWVYYSTIKNNIEGLYWSSASWSAFDLWSSAPAVAQGTSASAVLESGVGQQWVYYRTTQGNIEGLYWDASAGTWTPFDSWPNAPAVAPGTSPSAVLESGVGQQWVYYQTVQGNIEALYWDASAGKWSEFDMWPSAPAVAPGTSPTAVLDQKTGKQWVYYHTAEGNIEGLCWNNAGTWSPFDYWPSAPAAAPGTSPTMVLESGVGQQWVYYQTAQGNIEGLYWDASAGKWEPFDMWPSAPAAAQGTSPTAVYESGVGQQWVYYHTAQGALDALYWDASAGKWSVFEPVPGAPAAAPWTSPTVIRESGVGQQWVYYVAAEGNIEGLYWDASAGTWSAFDQWPGAPPA